MNLINLKSFYIFLFCSLVYIANIFSMEVGYEDPEDIQEITENLMPQTHDPQTLLNITIHYLISKYIQDCEQGDTQNTPLKIEGLPADLKEQLLSYLKINHYILLLKKLTPKIDYCNLPEKFKRRLIAVDKNTFIIIMEIPDSNSSRCFVSCITNISLWSMQPLQCLANNQVLYDVNHCNLSEDKKTLFIFGDENITAYNVDEKTIKYAKKTRARIKTVALNDKYICGTHNKKITILDTQSGNFILTRSCPETLLIKVFGDNKIITNYPGETNIWEISGSSLIHLYSFTLRHILAYRLKENILLLNQVHSEAIYQDKLEATLINMVTNKQLSKFDFTACDVNEVKVDTDNMIIFFHEFENSHCLILADAITGRVIRKLNLSSYLSYDFTKDNQTIFLYNTESAIQIIRVMFNIDSLTLEEALDAIQMQKKENDIQVPDFIRSSVIVKSTAHQSSKLKCLVS